LKNIRTPIILIHRKVSVGEVMEEVYVIPAGKSPLHSEVIGLFLYRYDDGKERQFY